jgi:hypothetical protein
MSLLRRIDEFYKDWPALVLNALFDRVLRADGDSPHSVYRRYGVPLLSVDHLPSGLFQSVKVNVKFSLCLIN